MFKNIIKKLGLDLKDYKQWENKSEAFKVHQLRRKIRYMCFAMQRGDVVDIPKKFIEYFSNQKHFSGWDLFADRWDVTKEDPSKTYPRVYSTLEEWEAQLRMVIPEIPGAISYKQGQ